MHSLLQRPGVRQFVKFCIVGVSSAAIDFGIFSLLVYALHLEAWLDRALAPWPAWQEFAQQQHLGILLAATLSFLVAVTNGFIWNRRWTFSGASAAAARTQYGKFVAVNVVGLCLNLGIIRGTVGLVAIVVGRALAPLAAKLLACGMVVFWNFTANRCWTFGTPGTKTRTTTQGSLP